MKESTIHFLIFVIGIAFLISSFVLYSVNVFALTGKDYTDTVNVVVVNIVDTPALGEVLTLNIDKKKVISVQKSFCINMDNVNINDTFKAVIVHDSNGILQCVVKVKE